MKTIAIDFDGVIHKYSKGWHDGSCYDDPMPGAIAAMETFIDEGYAVFIHSTRPPQQIQAWIAEHQFHIPTQIISQDTRFWNTPKVIGITDRKLPAMIYIDDRAYRFQGWEETSEDLEQLLDA